MAEGSELDDIYINEIPAEYEVPFSWENELLLTDSGTDLTAEFCEPSYGTTSNLPCHRPLLLPPPPLQVRPPLPRYDTDCTGYGSSHSVHSISVSSESLDNYHGTRQSISRVRSLSSAFNSESRAKIKEAILKGRDYLVTKVQDYQHRIRSNMNNRQRDVLNNHTHEADPHDLTRNTCPPQSNDTCHSSYKDILPSYEEVMQIERPPDTINDNQNPDQDLVSVNVQHPQEYASNNDSNEDRAPLLEQLPPESETETLPEEAADILNRASSLAASGEDDLPLGTDANTLSEIPSGAALSSHGSQIIDVPPVSPLLLPKSPASSLSPAGLSTGDQHQWLQALPGRQQSFGSDLSTGTNSSVNSIEILLQGREADPEEILMSLGFGSTEDNSTLTSRIPSRFLMLNSDTRGVSIDDLLGQHSELQELIENWNTQKYSSGQSVNPVHVSKALQFLSANEVPSRYLHPSSETMRQMFGIEKERDEENKPACKFKNDLNVPPPLPPPPPPPPPPPYPYPTTNTAITCSPKKDKALRTPKLADTDNRLADAKHLKTASPYHSPVRNPVLTDLTLNEDGFDDVSWSSESSVTLSSYINLRLAPNESLV